MRHARVFAIAGLAAMVAAVAYAAQTTVAPAPDNPPVETTDLSNAPLQSVLNETHWGDAEAGQAKASACAACHGVDGNPTDPQYPRIAGQSERYIARQLALFASGQRTGGMAAVMIPFAQALTPQEMRDVGAYFAQQRAGSGVADDSVVEGGPYDGMKYYEIGQKLYLGGDAERGIPACMACHGPSGAGNPGPAYPRIGGQMADYTERRLHEFKSGVTEEQDRALFEIMAEVAQGLTEQEISALASYLQGLHDRADDAEAGQVAAAAGAPSTQP